MLSAPGIWIPVGGDQARPAHFSLPYRGVLLGVSLWIPAGFPDLLCCSKCHYSNTVLYFSQTFTEYINSSVVWKLPEINMKFHDQHMVDKWLRNPENLKKKMDFRNENKNMVIAALWSYEKSCLSAL